MLGLILQHFPSPTNVTNVILLSDDELGCSSHPKLASSNLCFGRIFKSIESPPWCSISSGFVASHLGEKQFRPSAEHELADKSVFHEGFVRQVLSHLFLHEEGVLELRSVEAVPALVGGDLLRLHGHLVGERLVPVERHFVLARLLLRRSRRCVQHGGRSVNALQRPRGR